MSIIAKKIIFTGRVQGVGFRYTATTLAKRFDVFGFVRNMSSGKVEMFIQGEKKEVKMYLDRLQTEFSGYITGQKSENCDYDPSYTDFQVTF